MSVIIEDRAFEDLSAFDDILMDRGSTFRASNIVMATAEKYESTPHWGTPAPEKSLALKGFRVLHCDPYIAYYKVQSGGVIDIYRVFHQRQDRSVLQII